jgi:hypothetical protein
LAARPGRCFVAILLAVSAIAGCTQGSSMVARRSLPDSTSASAPADTKSRRTAAPSRLPVMPLRVSPTGRLLHVYDVNQHVTGDQLELKYYQRCGDMPFPGEVAAAYQMHQCWIAVHRGTGPKAGDLMYLFGYLPGSHRRKQVVLVAVPNQSARTIHLPDRGGSAGMVQFGNTCAVIGYAHSTRRLYYKPSKHHLVRFCRWRN